MGFSRSPFPAGNNERDSPEAHLRAETANGIFPKRDSRQKQRSGFSRNSIPSRNDKRDFPETQFRVKMINGILPKRISKRKQRSERFRNIISSKRIGKAKKNVISEIFQTKTLRAFPAKSSKILVLSLKNSACLNFKNQKSIPREPQRPL